MATTYKPGDRIGKDCLCFGNIWSPNCCHKRATSAPAILGSDGFYYGADGLEAAQKNVADAQAALTQAQNIAGAALAEYNRKKQLRDQAKADSDACEAMGHKKCKDWQAKYDVWGNAQKALDLASAALSSANSNVDKAKANLEDAIRALNKVANSNPQAVQAQIQAQAANTQAQIQANAQQQQAQAQIQAGLQSAKIRSEGITKNLMIVGGILVFAGAVWFFGFRKKAA